MIGGNNKHAPNIYSPMHVRRRARGRLTCHSIRPSQHRQHCGITSCSHHHCDVLVVDGTNIMCMSKAGAVAAKLVDPTSAAQGHAASFKAWMRFIAHVALPRSAAIVVFDTANVGVKSVRQQAVPGYLQKRHEKHDKRSAGETLDERMIRSSRWPPTGYPLTPSSPHDA